MDSSTKRRLALGFLVSWIGKFASSAIQFVQIPVFFHFWGTPLYGEWMIVNSIPAYLSFSNIGFGSVAGNEMTMMSALLAIATALSGSSKAAGGSSRSSARAPSSCSAARSTIFPRLGLLKLNPPSASTTRSGSSSTSALAVMFGQIEQLLQSAYRSISAAIPLAP